MYGARSSIIYDEHLDQFKELELIDEENPNQDSENSLIRNTGVFEPTNEKHHSNSYQFTNESNVHTRMTGNQTKNQRMSANLVDPKYKMSVDVEINETVD